MSATRLGRFLPLLALLAPLGMVIESSAAPGSSGNGTELRAAKTMDASLVATFGWTLSKTATPTTLDLDTSESETVAYTVGATRGSQVLVARFDGDVCVTNAGAVPTQGLRIVDNITKPPRKTILVSVEVDVSEHPVLAPGETHCYGYSISLDTGVAPGATYKDTAKVSITNPGVKGRAPIPSATAKLPDAPSDVHNESLDVVDSNGSSWTFTDSGTVGYSSEFTCPQDSGSHLNTVSSTGFVATPVVPAPEPQTATVTVTCRTADVALTKVADAETVSAGSPVGFTITAVNAGPGTATGVSINDPLPAASGVNWSVESQTGNACSITGAVGSQVLSCTVGDLAPLGSYAVHVTSPTAFAGCATLSNTATATATGEPADALANNSSSASVTVECSDLDLTKTADDASVDAGSPVGFTITAANSGPGTATGVTINDPLPAASGVNWSVESQTGNACSITGAVGSQVLSCTIGDLAALASYTVHVTSPTAFASCTTLGNTATLNATNAPTQTANASTTVQCSDLDLTKTADAENVSAGSPVGFTITAANSGPGTATGVTINDPLPAGTGLNWSIESQTGNDCSITGAVGSQVLSCTIGDLVALGSYAVHITSATTIADCSTVLNTATLTATNAPTQTANAGTTVSCTDPDLDLTKSADAPSVDAGSPIGFTITAANSGPGTATGVTISDPLPAASGVTWSVESQTGDDCSITGAVGSQVLSCTIGDLVALASYTVHVTSPTTFASCTTLGNTATLNATNAPTQTANANTTVQCSDLDLTKTADDASLDAGSPVGFTITAANSGPGTATGVTINDPLPAASGVNWSVESQTGNACSITGAVGSQVLSCTIGDLAALASYTVHVTSPTAFASCSALPNTATLNASNAPTQTASATTTVQCPDLNLTKIADAVNVSAGSPVGFTITASNSGPGTATGVTISDPLPTASGVDWSIESQTGNDCSIVGSVGSEVLVCTIGDLVALGTYTVHVTSPTTLAGCAALPNTATLNATNAPTLTANAITTVQCP